MTGAADKQIRLFTVLLHRLRWRRQWGIFVRGVGQVARIMTVEAALILSILLALACAGYLQPELFRPLARFLAETVVVVALCFGAWRSATDVPALAALAAEIDADQRLHDLLASGYAFCLSKRVFGLSPLVIERALAWLQTNAQRLYSGGHLQARKWLAILILPFIAWQLPLATENSHIKPRQLQQPPTTTKRQSDSQQKQTKPATISRTQDKTSAPRPADSPQLAEAGRPSVSATNNSQQQNGEAKQNSQQQNGEAKQNSQQQNGDAKQNSQQQNGDAKQNSQQQNGDAKQNSQQQANKNGDRQSQEKNIPSPSPQQNDKKTKPDPAQSADSREQHKQPANPQRQEKRPDHAAGHDRAPDNTRQHEGKEKNSRSIQHNIRSLFADGEKWLSQQSAEVLSPDAQGSEETVQLPSFFYQAEQFLQQNSLPDQHQEAIRRYLDLIRPQ